MKNYVNTYMHNFINDGDFTKSGTNKKGPALAEPSDILVGHHL